MDQDKPDETQGGAPAAESTQKETPSPISGLPQTQTAAESASRNEKYWGIGE
jgi:hypothetical protein